MMFVPKFRSGGDASTSETTLQPERPKPVIGLALGGGSARGWAHIGILHKLDALGIRPQVVVGTSIGAVVGGAWAAGRLPELEAFARGITKRSMLGMMDFRIVGSGLLSGDRLRKQLEERFHGQRIEDLPTRFAAIATELKTGHEVWLTRGPISDAMRASYALPGIFVPVYTGGRWLMDGALSNPVPVSVARALGADIVIAVNLHTDVLGRAGIVHEHGGEDQVLPEPTASAGLLAPVQGMANLMRRQFGGGVVSEDRIEPPGILSVMLDAFNVTQDRIARSRLAGDPPDVTVAPKIGGIGLSEFHRADEAIRAGESAAQRVADDIKDLVASLSQRR
ncbi:MAG: patatin-like phospholipase family protein [Beijerinckiaceae bacterium]